MARGINFLPLLFQEQRSHIQILDTALSTAQTQVLRLEEENRTKEGYVERIKQMTKSLEQLQAGKQARDLISDKPQSSNP